MKLTQYFEKRKKERIRRERIRVAKTALTSVVTGSVLGAVSGVLFAPKAGKETRQDIAKYSENVTHELSDKLTEGKERLNEATGKIKEFIAEKKAVRSNKNMNTAVGEIAATEEE